MNPYFFGSSDRPLFGAFHPSASASDRAALLCYPIAQEYMRSHRAMGTLARRLGETGLHVLRFDYSGTGDSGGPATVEQWRRDVRAAAGELRDVSGAPTLVVIGARFGAALAATEAAAIGAAQVILWDPVESGEDYLAGLEAMHRAMLGDPMRFAALRTSGPDELLGFGFPGPLRREIAAFDLCRDAPEAAAVDIVSSVDGTGENLSRVLSRAGRQCSHQTVEDSCNWSNVSNLEDQVLAPKVIEAIAHSAGR